MRKLLLATAAMLGATSGLAMAQEAAFAPSQGMTAMPPNPSPPASSFNASNAHGNVVGHVGSSSYGAMKPPTPGTVVIHLGGKVQVDVVSQWSTNNQVLGAKSNPVNINSYMRLYPGVDGMATNGLRYGASIELRENFPGSAAQPGPLLVGVSGATGAATVTTAASGAPSGSGYTSGQTVFVRRAFVYLANDSLGIVRVGNTDGVIGLFDNGTFTSATWDAGIGNFNGGTLQGTGVTGAFAVPFVWLAQAGAEYGNSKIVYLSPQFFGFDFGVQYAPSMGNGNSGCGTAGFVNCNSTTTGLDATRWYNQVGVGARYQGVFGPLAVGAYAFYETAGKESFFGPASSFRNGGGTTAGVGGNRFDNLSFVNAGAYAAFDTGAGKVTWAASYNGGAVNGQLAMRPTGGVAQNAVVTGLVYQNGPLTLGAEVGLVESQGTATLTGVSQRHEFEFAMGGNFMLAPGLYLVGEYQYEQRHQGGFDFIAGAQSAAAAGSGAAGTSTWKAGATRDAHGQGVQVSLVVNW